MKSFTGSAAVVGLVVSVLILIQALTIGVVSLLYFTGYIPADSVQIGSVGAVILFLLFLMILAAPGLIGFFLRKRNSTNLFLKIEGVILSLFFPLHVIVLPVPGPIFLLFIVLGSLGLFILAVVSHAKQMEKEENNEPQTKTEMENVLS